MNEELRLAEAQRVVGEEVEARTLGVERWVQFVFIAGALVAFWIFDHLIGAAWNMFAEPEETLVTLSAVVASGVLTFVLARRSSAKDWTREVAQELAKSTWPSRKETWAATIVVTITSL